MDTSGNLLLTKTASALRMALGLGSLVVLSACGGGGGDAAAPEPVSLGAALPVEGDFIVIEQVSLNLSESARTGSVTVSRLGSVQGSSTVDYKFIAGSADASTDFRGTDGTLSWADGDNSTKTISFIVESDLDVEGAEDFRIEISDLSGQESLGINDSVNVTVDDVTCNGSIPGSIDANTVLSEPCYRLLQNTTVSSSALLQIKAGTTIIADSATSITLNGSATLSMEGSDRLPVFIKSAGKQAGYWNGIQLQSASALHRVKYTEIDGAVNAFDLSSGGFGVFNNNVIANTSGAGVKLPLADAENLGTENHFSETTRGIELVGSKIAVNQTVLLPEQSTHYVLANALINEGTLKLAAGTDLRMAADVGVLVLSSGAINAAGTLEKPIAIQGLESRLGYWDGFQYVSSNSESNRFEHVRISHGGGDPARAGNIIIAGLDTQITMQHCELTHSAGYGVVYDSRAFHVDQLDVTYSQNRLGEQSL